ncbi:hypothetical protein C6P44_002713 [Monosporozyma unispora]|nr:hypothetical protein C6P44_002713 [Kazachstania unispora]
MRDNNAMLKYDYNGMSLAGGSYDYNIPMTDIKAVIEFIKLNRSQLQDNSNNIKLQNELDKKREDLLGVSNFDGMR